MELKDLEPKLAEMKTALEQKAANDVRIAVDAEIKKLNDAAAEIKGLPEGVTPEKITEMMTKAQKAIDDAAKTVEGFDKLQISLKSTPLARQEQKSFNQVFTEALEQKHDDIAKFQRKETKSLVIEMKAVGDMTTGNVTGGSRYGQVMRSGIIENPNRKVHVPDLMPGGDIGPGNTFTFMRENGQGEGNPAPVAEGATKPQFDLDLVEATVQVETVAGWVRVTRKAMANIPGFISFLQSRLPEKFKRVLDAQILYGSGVSPQLKGILTAGNFVASGTTLNTFLAEKITTDIAVLEDTYERDATAVLLRPIDIATFYNNKAAGSGEYDLPRNVTFEGSQLYISGVPVYATTALNSPDYVVGDFRMGAQLLTQEGMRIEFFEQDGTNVRENKVTVRIEGNYALPVYGPDYFIKGTTARA